MKKTSFKQEVFDSNLLKQVSSPCDMAIGEVGDQTSNSTSAIDDSESSQQVITPFAEEHVLPAIFSEIYDLEPDSVLATG